MSAPPALLLASSHVARGTVGLRAAVHASEALGHPTWAVPTVFLPWHPGQGPGTRAMWGAHEFAAYAADLARSPHLGEVGGLATGYLGEPAQAGALAGLIGALRRANPAAIVLCDPVIGGERGLYVPRAVAEAIRDELVPLADIVTPNRHELAWLAGLDAAPATNAGLAAAARSLPPPRALVTSAHGGGGDGAGRTGNLLVEPDRVTLAAHARFHAPESGTGDLTAALLLAHLVAGRPDALARATASVAAVMRLAAGTNADELPLERAREALVAPDVGAVELHEIEPGGPGGPGLGAPPRPAA